MLAAHRVKTDFGTFALPCKHKHRPGEAVHVLARFRPVSRGALIRGVARDVIFQQERYRVVLDNSLRVDLPREPRKGSRIAIQLRLECLGSGAAA